MKYEFTRNNTNNALILASIHPDFKGSNGTFLHGGKITSADALSDTDYFSRLEYAFKKHAGKLVTQELATILSENESFGPSEAIDYIKNEMNQWLDSIEDIKTYFTAFKLVISPETTTKIDQMNCVFPSDITK